jgi:hypothetical protein
MMGRIAVIAAIIPATAWSATTGAQGLEGAYRGMFVCEQIRGSVDILHVPLDLAVRGSDVQFARPLFNLAGTRVVGSELGVGTVDGDGKLHLTSAWDSRGIAVKGDYSGTLTPTGGTLTGTQNWRGRDGIHGSRTCTGALVPAPKAQEAASEE